MYAFTYCIIVVRVYFLFFLFIYGDDSAGAEGIGVKRVKIIGGENANDNNHRQRIRKRGVCILMVL